MLPEAYLDVADELVRAGGPGRLRSAVSRAYYAGFHIASEASAKLGAPRSDSHEVIGDRFQTSDHPEISAVSRSPGDEVRRAYHGFLRRWDAAVPSEQRRYLRVVFALQRP